MTDQELNESLLKKIGFSNSDKAWQEYCGENTPDFVRDLNACFKWLVPELRKRGITVIKFFYFEDGIFTRLSGAGIPTLSSGKAALESTALCMAANKFLR